MQEGIDKFGLSASASSLVTGFSYAHQTLENEICQWLNKPRCLLFSSGVSANLGILQALGQSSANIWLDKLSHASLIEGAFSSQAKVKRFKHNDVNHLDTLISTFKTKSHTDKNLQESPLKTRDNLIVSEGIFSMDGDQAPIEQLSSLSNRYDGKLFIDDAHSIGVIGDKGQGSSSLANIDIVMATFGKAIASSGAFVACEEDVFEYLTNFSKHYIYSTAISPALAWATNQSIKLIQTEHWRREKITELSEQFSQLLSPSIDLIPTQSSIHGLIIGGEEKTLLASKKLKERGIWVTAIRPPTVPLNSSRLRVTICSNHNANDIKCLAQNINEILS
jgi:8-amino-7-oxononanoate synthase